MSNKMPLGSGGSQAGSYDLQRNASQEMHNHTQGDNFSFSGLGSNVIAQGQVINEMSVSGNLSPPYGGSVTTGIKKINITFNNQMNTSHAIASVTGGLAFTNLRDSNQYQVQHIESYSPKIKQGASTKHTTFVKRNPGLMN